MLDLIDLKPFSHEDHPIGRRVFIGDQDITSFVKSVDSIRQKSDYPELHTFRASELNITLLDPDGYFTTTNKNSFFIENNLPDPDDANKKQYSDDGFGFPIRIDVGFIVDGIEKFNTMFTGKILKIDQGSEGTAIVRSVDKMHELFKSRITDFGIERTFKLVPYDVSGHHGIYPIPEFLREISTDSDSILKAHDKPLTRVARIKDSGKFNSDHYEVKPDCIRTEGGFPKDVAEGYPQITFKSPYKGKRIKDLIVKLLDHVGITNHNIIIPTVTMSPHFSDAGRIGYDFIGTHTSDKDVPISWQGYATDQLEDNGIFYYLYNTTLSDHLNRSRLVSYDPTTDESKILWQAPKQAKSVKQRKEEEEEYLKKLEEWRKDTTVGAEPQKPNPGASGFELWKMAKSGNKIAILCTSSDARIDIDREIEATISIPFAGPDRYTIKVVFNIPVIYFSMKNTIIYNGVEQNFDESKLYRARETDDVPTGADFNDVSKWIQDSRDLTHTPSRAFLIDLKVDSKNQLRPEFNRDAIRDYLSDSILPDLQDIVPEDGNYIPVGGNSTVFIQEIDISTDPATSTILIPTNADKKAILGHYYPLGEGGIPTAKGNVLPFASYEYFLPDTQRPIGYHQGYIVYAYADLTAEKFGIMKHDQVVNSFDINGYNFAGVYFIIAGNTVYTLTTNMDDDNSNSDITIHSHTLPTITT